MVQEYGVARQWKTEEHSNSDATKAELAPLSPLSGIIYSRAVLYFLVVMTRNNG
jgi:hypothetical protein